MSSIAARRKKLIDLAGPAYDWDGQYAIQKAIYDDRYDHVEAWLAAGGNPNGPTNHNGTRLIQIAAEDDHIRFIPLLKRYGADLDARNIYGTTALTSTGVMRHTKGRWALLDAGANINAPGESGNTLLHLRAHGIDAEDVQAILLRGADVHARNVSGMTPLHFAVTANDPSVVRCLMEAGSDPNAQDKKGRTPLHSAIRHFDDQIVDLLVKAGANVEIADRNGFTPMYMAQTRAYGRARGRELAALVVSTMTQGLEADTASQAPGL